MGDNMNVPELRFGEFSGEWDEKQIGSTSEIVGGGTPETIKEEYWNGNIQWFTPTEIKSKFISNSARKITELGLKKSSAKLLPKGTLLFSSRATVGDVGIALEECTTNQGFQSFIVNNKHNAEFLYNWIIQNKKEFIRKASGSTFLEISKKEIVKIKLRIPLKQEQQKIASFLSSVDTKIEQLTSKAKLLQEYKKGVMQKIFSQEIRFRDDTPGQPLLPDGNSPSDGSEFPEWVERKLGEISVINPRNNKIPDTFIYIDLESVKNGLLLKSNSISNEDAPSRAQRLLIKNDILFQMVRPYQKNNYFFNLDGDYIASTGYAQLRAKQSSKYLYHFLHTSRFVNNVLTCCTGTSYPAINSSDLSKIKIKLPQSIKEQTKIANFLSSIDSKIEQTQKQLDSTKEFKKALLQQMFV